MGIDTTRRAVVAGLVALPLMTRAAFALSGNQATALIQQMSADIVKTVNSGQPDAQMYADFERLMNKYADMPTIARYALGPAARGVSAGDLASYTKAFTTYIARKYGSRFREFIGGNLAVGSSEQSGDNIIVHVTAKLRNQQPASVDFHVSDKSGSPKVFNVILEGINMLTSERTEIMAMLDQNGGSIARLTQALQTAK